MSETNANKLQNYEVIQSPQFVDNTLYNPFAQSKNTNNSKNQNINPPEYQQITCHYLNEIKNEGPKSTNLQNSQISNGKDKDKSELNNEPIIQNSGSYEIRTNNEMAIEFENAIRQEVEETTPLISEKLNIQILLDDYKSKKEYSNSVKIITEKYKYLRKVRRDGNCFYRSFIYRLFENICMKNDNSLYNIIIKK